MKKIFIILFSMIVYTIAAQTPENTPGTTPVPMKAASFVKDLKSFRDIDLGTDIAAVKKLLANDPLFNYRGDPDVMFTPDKKQTIIECTGNSFIERAYFQFNEDRLFIITIVLNRTSLDYYSMFVTFSNKYGPPASLNPDEAIWNFADTMLSIEKPLRIKYIATKVFDKLKEAGKAEKSAEDISREKFLGEF